MTKRQKREWFFYGCFTLFINRYPKNGWKEKIDMETGVLASYREKFLFLKEGCLTDEEFILYEYCIHQADFNENHIGKFGRFEMTNKEIGFALLCSEDKVGRCLRKLLEKGLLKRVNRRRIEVVDFYRYLPKNAYKRIKTKEELSYMQTIIANIKSENAELRKVNAKLRKTMSFLALDSHPVSDTISSKLTPLIYDASKDYTKEQGKYSLLTADDMQWIDQNVREESIS